MKYLLLSMVVIQGMPMLLFAETESSSATVYCVAASQAQIFADFERFTETSALDQAVAEARRRAATAGVPVPEELDDSERNDLVMRWIVQASPQAPAQAGLYIVYYVQDYFVFFGPIKQDDEAPRTLSILETLLRKLRNRQGPFQTAFVFPWMVDSAAETKKLLDTPGKLVASALGVDTKLLESLRWIEVLQRGNHPLRPSDQNVIAQLRAAMSQREQGGWTGNRAIAFSGQQVLSPVDFDELAYAIGEQLIGSSWTAEELKLSPLPGKWKVFHDLSQDIFKKAGIGQPLREEFRAQLETLASFPFPDEAARAKAAFSLAGRTWLLHQAMRGSHAYEVAAAIVTKEFLDELKFRELGRDAKSSFGPLLRHAMTRCRTSGPAVPVPERSMIRVVVQEAVVSEYLKWMTSTKPAPEVTDEEVNRGLQEIAEFLNSDPQALGKYSGEDAIRWSRHGATFQEWVALQRLLEKAFGFHVASNIVERSGGAVRRTDISPGIIRSVLCQFGQQAVVCKSAALWRDALNQDGLDVRHLVHEVSNDRSRRLLLKSLTIRTMESLLPAGYELEDLERFGFSVELARIVQSNTNRLLPSASPELIQRFDAAAVTGLNGTDALALLNQAADEIVIERTNQAVKKALDAATNAADSTAAFQQLTSQWGLTNVDDHQAVIDREVNKLLGEKPATLPPEVTREWLAEMSEMAVRPPTDNATTAEAPSDQNSSVPSQADATHWSHAAMSQTRHSPGQHQPPQDQQSPESSPNGTPGENTPAGNTANEATQEGKPVENGSRSEGSEDGDPNAKSSGGDGAGGGFLPGDMPLLRAIFQSLAKYLGVEELARKILELAYLLDPKLFEDIADALEQLANKITPQELKDLANDYNKLIALLGPALNQLDAALDVLMEKGIEATLDHLVNQGLETLTEEGLKLVSEKTGIPLDTLKSLRHLPDNFSLQNVVDRSVQRGKEEALSQMRSWVQEKLHLPGSFIEDLAAGRFEDAGKKAVEEARTAAQAELEKAVGIPNLSSQLATPEGRLQLVDSLRNQAIEKSAAVLGADRECLRAVLQAQTPEAATQAMEMLVKNRLQQELAARTPLSPEMLDKPLSEWPTEVGTKFLTRELEVAFGPDAGQLSGALLQGQTNEIVQIVTTRAKLEGEALLKQKGIDAQLFSDLAKANYENALTRLEQLPTDARQRIVQAGLLTQKVMDNIVVQGAVNRTAAVASLKRELRARAAASVKLESELISALEKGPEVIQDYLRSKLDQMINDVADELKRKGVADPQRAQTLQKLQRLIAASDKLADAIPELAAQVQLTAEEVADLLENRSDRLFQRLSESLLKTTVDELVKNTPFMPTTADLAGKLAAIQDQATQHAVQELSVQHPALQHLPELLTGGDVQQVLAHMTTSFRQLANLPPTSRGFLEALASENWHEAVKLLNQHLTKADLQHLVERELLPTQALEMKNALASPEEVESLGKEMLVSLFSGQDGKHMPRATVAMFLNGSSTQRVKSLKKLAVAQLSGLSDEMEQTIAENQPEILADQLHSVLWSYTKNSLGLQDDVASSAAELSALMEQRLQQEWSNRTTSIFDIAPEKLATLTEGKLDALGEEDLLAILQAWVAQKGLDQVSKSLELNAAQFAIYLQSPRVSETRESMLKRLEGAKQSIRKELLTDYLFKIDEEKLRERTRISGP